MKKTMLIMTVFAAFVVAAETKTIDILPGIQPPLKFSNYGRQKDGSYILVRRAGTQTKLNE